MYYNRMRMFDIKLQQESVIWQVIEENQVTGYVDKNGNKVKLPKIYEMFVEEDELEGIE